MIRFLLTIFFLGAAILVFFGFTSVHYASVQKLQTQQIELTVASKKMKQLNEARSTLLEKYNAFSQDDISRLQKALPDNVDNIKLIRDIDGIAERYDLNVRNVAVDIGGDAPGVISAGDKTYGTVILSFSVACSYETFLSFLSDLEQSLRVVDVVSIAFDTSDTGQYGYTVSLKTYWLK
jgi:hypothetical protein